MYHQLRAVRVRRVVLKSSRHYHRCSNGGLNMAQAVQDYPVPNGWVEERENNGKKK